MLTRHLRPIILMVAWLLVLVLATATPGLAAAKWTFMVYLDGDNNLEEDAVNNFIEMAAVGSDANLNIVVQFQRQQATATRKDLRYGGWTTCKRFLVTLGMVPTEDKQLSDLGTVNMGSPGTLRDFINWATAGYPAEHYALVLWDHGSGWELYYPRPTAPREYYVCQSDIFNTALSMADVKAALVEANSKVELLGLDTCLMNMLEVAYEFRNAGPTVMVGSEAEEPGEGWPYHTILRGLQQQPAWTAAQFGSWIVDKYFESGRPTQSALDLTRMETLAGGINALVSALQSERRHNTLLIQNRAHQLMAAIKQTVINNKCDTGKFPGAYGLALYFPQNQGEAGELVNYTPGVIDFAGATTWGGFLQNFLTNLQHSWLSNIRWQTQVFETESHIDLYDLCQRLSEASTAVPDYIISVGPYSNFNDIADTGTKIDFPASDYTRLSLPFPLVFYGKSYQTISVSKSGVIYFDDLSLGPAASPIPGDNDYGVNTFIAPYWANLNDDYCEVYYQVLGEAPSRNLIVQWKGFVSGSATSAFQAVFYEGSRDIIFHYPFSISNLGNLGTGGIQKDLFTGIQAFRNTSVPVSVVQFSAMRPAPIPPVLQILLLDE